MHPIKRERARRRWSLRELAARSGVPAGTISGVERGQREPQILTLAKIADALEVDVEELASSPKVPSRPSPAAPEEVPTEERRTADIGREAPADRVEVLEQGWIPPVKERVERWRTEIDGWRRQGSCPYGRADEMDAYAKDRILKRAEEIGLIDHLQAVLGGGKEVFPRELEACRVLNNELLAEAFDLVAEAYKVEHELGLERRGQEEGILARLGVRRLDKAPRAGARSA